MFPGSITKPFSNCQQVQFLSNDKWNASFYIQAYDNVSLHCFSESISNVERGLWTLSFMAVPFVFFFFELLRFRTFSAWIEGKFDTRKMPRCAFYLLFKPVKFLFNFLHLLTWPLVAFFRQAYFHFRYSVSTDAEKNGQWKNRSFIATTIGSRSKLIEVCTEASLQPLLQVHTTNRV